MEVNVSSRPYEHAREHILEELKRLDLLLEAGLSSMTAPMDDPALDPFRGLVVTESEARQLLYGDGRFARPGDEQEEQLAWWEERIASRVRASEAEGIALPLAKLQRAYGLDEWDVRCLMIAIAPEIDRKYEKLYAYLQDDMTNKFATVDLILRLCCRDERERRDALPRLTTSSPWFRSLIRKEAASDGTPRSLLSRPVRVDERVVSYIQQQEWRFEGPLRSMRLYAPGEAGPFPGLPEDAALCRRLQRHLERQAVNGGAGPALYMVHGPIGSGKTLLARTAASGLGKPLLEWNVASAPADEEAFLAAADDVLREAKLEGAIPAFDNLQAIAGAADAKDGRAERLVARLMERGEAAFLMSRSAWKTSEPMPPGAVWTDIALALPDAAARAQLWSRYAGETFALTEAAAGVLAAKFRFTPGRIADTVAAAVHLYAWESDASAAPAAPPVFPLSARLLHRAGYLQVRHRLNEKAVKLEPKFSWEELILPADTKGLLRQACNRLLYRHVVFGRWGFERKLAYGKGISMLFTGPPGTGKTMSAMVMAKEMDAELYRIDLSRMVSKYIGETEKNLSEIFDEAQLSGAILFFDEADALFGKRSEVKDAHDKYANMETSYLLQKMEEYDGLTILASNFAQNLDEAFTRRIQFIVKYPFPDPEQREQLWRGTFPKELPADPDIDFPYLARTFDLAGGPIKNVVLTAAFLAAEEETAIAMKHMMEAVKQEYKKTGKVLLRDRLGAYADK